MEHRAESIVVTAALSLMIMNPCWAQIRAYRYPLPLKTATATEICGARTCNPGNGEGSFHFTEEPYVIFPEAGETLKEISLRLVGRLRLKGDKAGGVPWECDGTFKPMDIEPKMKSVATKLDSTKVLDVGAKAKATFDVDQLIGLATFQPEKRNVVQDALEAEYESKKTTKIVMRAVYHEYGLLDDKLRAILQSGSDSCANVMEKYPVELITDVGLVEFDLERGQSLSTLSKADLKLSLSKAGLADAEIDAVISYVTDTAKDQGIKGAISVVSERRVSWDDSFHSSVKAWLANPPRKERGRWGALEAFYKAQAPAPSIASSGTSY